MEASRRGETISMTMQEELLSVYAALLSGGEVVVFGDGGCGGDMGAAAPSLTSGIVAIKADGSVVAWGDQDYGGDTSSVS